MKKIVTVAVLAALAGAASADVSFRAATGADLNIARFNNLAETGSRFTDVSYGIGGFNSWDAYGDVDNEAGTAFAGANAHVTGIGWNTFLTTTPAGTFGGSWDSEAQIGFFNSDFTQGVILTAYGAGTPVVNANSNSPVVDLVGLALDFNLNGDGTLVVYFYESFDDSNGEIDAHWLSGSSVTVRYDPIPAPGALALLGLAGLAGRRRR